MPDTTSRALCSFRPPTPQQIALAWQLRRSPVSVPIPGTRSLLHLRENIAGQDIELADEEFDAISAISDEA